MVSCTFYFLTREKLKRLWSGYRVPLLMDLIPDLLGGSLSFLQFILDASVLPSVITLVQTYGQGILMPTFNLSRTWCYPLQREHLRLMVLFNFG